MTNKVRYQSWIPRIGLRPVTTASTIGALLLSAVPAALSQDKEAGKPPAFTTLYTFTGGSDGFFPNSLGADNGMTPDNRGNLFGTTTNGGASSCEYDSSSGCGVVFKLDRAGKQTVLHTFTGPDGAGPIGGLVRDEEGNLYGATNRGGSGSLPAGTVFKLDPNGKETILHSFTGGSDGNSPYAGVIRDEEGNLYGTTFAGGAFCTDSGGCGVVYKLDRAGNETVLYSFTGGADGRGPAHELIRDKDGTLFGITGAGGAYRSGVVFKLDRAGKQSVLYTFMGGADGKAPSSLIRDKEGTFYGGTLFGGAHSSNCFLGSCGVVFKLTPSGEETVLYTFTGGADGSDVVGRLLRRGKYLYGVTFFGGDFADPSCGGCGVVFRLDLAGNFTVLHTFTDGADGGNPFGGLTERADGSLYGVAETGGDYAPTSCQGLGCGVVFKLELCREDDGDSAGENSTGVTEDSAAPATQHPTALAPDGRVPTGLWDPLPSRPGPWYRIPSTAAWPTN